jgi:hypothetical protein
MTFKAARFANLFLTGVLTGNEFGGFVGFHPALYRLPTDAHASAEQAITARFGKIMPPLHGSHHRLVRSRAVAEAGSSLLPLHHGGDALLPSDARRDIRGKHARKPPHTRVGPRDRVE